MLSPGVCSRLGTSNSSRNGVHSASLANGDLVEVLPKHPPAPAHTSLYAVHPYQRFVPPKVKTFVDFLVERYGKGYDWAHHEGSQG